MVIATWRTPVHVFFAQARVDTLTQAEYSEGARGPQGRPEHHGWDGQGYGLVRPASARVDPVLRRTGPPESGPEAGRTWSALAESRLALARAAAVSRFSGVPKKMRTPGAPSTGNREAQIVSRPS